MATLNNVPEKDLASFDLNLPLRAILAASELDELSKGRTPKGEHLKNLSALLKSSFQPSAQSRDSFINSSTVAVLFDALAGLPSQPKLSTMDDLVERALEIAGELDRDEFKGDEQLLEKLKRFCIALSSSAAAFRYNVLDVHEPQSI